jgi:methylmalonyl-CoA mutase, C-terminal domain
MYLTLKIISCHTSDYYQLCSSCWDIDFKNILVLGGGIIPQKDKKILETKGVYGNFGPGTPLRAIIDYIKTNARISDAPTHIH